MFFTNEDQEHNSSNFKMLNMFKNFYKWAFLSAVLTVDLIRQKATATSLKSDVTYFWLFGAKFQGKISHTSPPPPPPPITAQE